MNDQKIIDTIRSLLEARPASASICPSDVARALACDEASWRALMPEIRRVAATLVAAGELQVTRGQAVVDPLARGGPIRLRSLRAGKRSSR